MCWGQLKKKNTRNVWDLLLSGHPDQRFSFFFGQKLAEFLRFPGGDEELKATEVCEKQKW